MDIESLIAIFSFIEASISRNFREDRILFCLQNVQKYLKGLKSIISATITIKALKKTKNSVLEQCARKFPWPAKNCNNFATHENPQKIP